MWNLPYLERLQILSLETLENRRIKNDLVLLYKIVYKYVDIESENMFSFNTNNTRGHWAKINLQYSRVNCRKYMFFNRTIPIWNLLPEEVIVSSNVYIFKTNLHMLNIDMYCRGHAHMAT